MAVLQKSVSSSLLGTLAASCILLIVLSLQGGAAVPVSSHCRLDNFQEPYITNYTFMLAKEASFADNNTDVRLIGDKLFRGVNIRDRCYLMKQVLNFTLEEVLFPQSDRFQPYMQKVLPFLADLSNKLSLCHIRGDDQHIQRNVQQLKDTVRKLGESGEIKAIGEVDLLFIALKNFCVQETDLWIVLHTCLPLAFDCIWLKEEVRVGDGRVGESGQGVIALESFCHNATTHTLKTTGLSSSPLRMHSAPFQSLLSPAFSLLAVRSVVIIQSYTQYLLSTYFGVVWNRYNSNEQADKNICCRRELDSKQNT
ncbi:interleukin-22 [Erethizon dorsatum]